MSQSHALRFAFISASNMTGFKIQMITDALILSLIKAL